MKALLPWFWKECQMPAREVRKLTASDAHVYIDAWAKQAKG